VGNALKFTPRGGSVTAQLRDWDAEVELRVIDTGTGIAPDDLPRIFDPYRQAHAGRKGSGLGLAVVKGMVEAHGGRVTVESELGRGSTFIVTLPRGERAPRAQRVEMAA
jgi:signal transduction histidine kinase